MKRFVPFPLNTLPKIEMCDHRCPTQCFTDRWNVIVLNSNLRQRRLVSIQRQQTIEIPGRNLRHSENIRLNSLIRRFIDVIERTFTDIDEGIGNTLIRPLFVFAHCLFIALSNFLQHDFLSVFLFNNFALNFSR